MTASIRFVTTLMAAALPFMPVVAAQQHPAMPAGMTHEEHSAQMKREAEMKQHGRMAMGFDQDKTTHHFTLTRDGGAIGVSANDSADESTRAQIRAHLQEVALAFGQGNFEKPLLTHSEVPPGVSGMQRHKSAIRYTFEPTDRGGSLRIATSDADALNAIHDFLRYQIREHGTGDPTTVQR
jgi:hypothetical protein